MGLGRFFEDRIHGIEPLLVLISTDAFDFDDIVISLKWGELCPLHAE